MSPSGPRRGEFRPHVVTGKRVSAGSLHDEVRSQYALGRISMATILSTLSRIVNRRLYRKERIRLSNVNCFCPALATARRVTTSAPHQGAGMGLGNVRFHSSRGLGGSINRVGVGRVGEVVRSPGLSRASVSDQLEGCFASRRVVRHSSFRSVANVIHSATVVRVHHLHARNGLLGVNVPDRPVCMPTPKFCKGPTSCRPIGW